MTDFQESQERDYYRAIAQEKDSLKYRLDAGDTVKLVLHDLRGGVIVSDDGRRKYNERYRKMNEVGIASVQSFLHSIISKVGHLTRYKNEERILMQQRANSRAFLKELVKNMKTWGPTVKLTFQDEDYDEKSLISEFGHDFLYVEKQIKKDGLVNVWAKLKVRNKDTLLLSIEAMMLQSSMRAHKGREQELTAPNVLHQEQVGGQQKQQGWSFFRGMSRQQEGDEYG